MNIFTIAFVTENFIRDKSGVCIEPGGVRISSDTPAAVMWRHGENVHTVGTVKSITHDGNKIYLDIETHTDVDGEILRADSIHIQYRDTERQTRGILTVCTEAMITGMLISDSTRAYIGTDEKTIRKFLDTDTPAPVGFVREVTWESNLKTR